MRALVLYFAILQLILASVADAQAADICPAPIQTGEWLIVDGAGVAAAGSSEGSMIMALPAGDTGKGQIANSCDGGFVLTGQSDDGIRMRFDMAPLDNVAGEALRYRGTFAHSFMTMTLDVALESDVVANGVFQIKGVGGGAQMLGQMPVRLQNTAAAISTHAACACRDHLKDFIDEEISGRRLIRDIYANTAHHPRPQSFERGFQWTPREYDFVVQRIAGQQLTLDQAVTALEESIFSGAFDAESDSTLTGTIAEGTVRVRAYTDTENCSYQMGTAHLDSCYPDIIHDSTVKHEQVHVAQCRNMAAGRVEEPSYSEAVSAFAQREIDAYNAEIEFLSNWIGKNCGG